MSKRFKKLKLCSGNVKVLKENGDKYFAVNSRHFMSLNLTMAGREDIPVGKYILYLERVTNGGKGK